MSFRAKTKEREYHEAGGASHEVRRPFPQVRRSAQPAPHGPWAAASAGLRQRIRASGACATAMAVPAVAFGPAALRAPVWPHHPPRRRDRLGVQLTAFRPWFDV